jgi:hypothetical protein
MARKVEQEIEQLNLLRDAAPDAARAALRRALSDRVNLMVAKAAKVSAELHLRDLIPDLVRAFDRLLENGVERDPQCWGKNAIAKALTDLEHRESAVYLRGSGHIQMEPVWGGREDTAGALRGLCLLALVACTDVPRRTLFRALVDALAEKAHTVRLEAVRALAQMEGDEASLLLRFKARTGDTEASVVGQVFESILQLEGAQGVSFVAGFLQSGAEAVREEAALSLGASRMPQALSALEEAWEATRDPDLRYVILRGLSASRQEEALNFLLDLVRNARMPDATAALEALSLHGESAEIRKQAQDAVEERGADLNEKFRRLFASV